MSFSGMSLMPSHITHAHYTLHQCGFTAVASSVGTSLAWLQSKADVTFQALWITVCDSLCDSVQGEITVIGYFTHFLTYLTPLCRDCILAFAQADEGSMAENVFLYFPTDDWVNLLNGALQSVTLSSLYMDCMPEIHIHLSASVTFSSGSRQTLSTNCTTSCCKFSPTASHALWSLCDPCNSWAQCRQTAACHEQVVTMKCVYTDFHH